MGRTAAQGHPGHSRRLRHRPRADGRRRRSCTGDAHLGRRRPGGQTAGAVPAPAGRRQLHLRVAGPRDRRVTARSRCPCRLLDQHRRGGGRRISAWRGRSHRPRQRSRRARGIGARQPCRRRLIGRRALLRQIRADLPIAVVTAGGIRTGAEIADAEQLGAVAAQLGTAFLCCRETGTTTARRAGTGWAAATEEPAAAIIARLERERRTALAGAD